MPTPTPKPPAGQAAAPGAQQQQQQQQQTIEQLKSRYTELDRRRVTAEANLRNATEQLEALKKQAREAYGTDDIEVLKAKLDAMRKENERRRAEYQQHLDAIERKLQDVEREYHQVRSLTGHG